MKDLWRSCLGTSEIVVSSERLGAMRRGRHRRAGRTRELRAV